MIAHSALRERSPAPKPTHTIQEPHAAIYIHVALSSLAELLPCYPQCPCTALPELSGRTQTAACTGLPHVWDSREGPGKRLLSRSQSHPRRPPISQDTEGRRAAEGAQRCVSDSCSENTKKGAEMELGTLHFLQQPQLRTATRLYFRSDPSLH